MDAELLRLLREITPEEQKILDGHGHRPEALHR